MLNSVYLLAALPNHYLRCIEVYPSEVEQPQDAVVATFQMFFKDGKADEMSAKGNQATTREGTLSGCHLLDLELVLDYPRLIPYGE